MNKSKKCFNRINRRKNGAALIVFMGIFMTYFVLTVGIVGFEFARYQLAITQLKNVLDAASLGGASMLAGNYTTPQSMNTNAQNPNNNNPPSPTWAPSANWPPPGTNTNQWNAMQAVNNIFTMNVTSGSPSAVQSVMGIALGGNTTVNYNVSQMSLANPGINKFNLNVGWISSITNQPVQPSDPNAKILSASATMGYQPAFFKFFGLTSNFLMPTSIQSRAGVAMLDLAICFDLSESMDDQTPMILVERYQNPWWASQGITPPIDGSDNANFYNVPSYNSTQYAYNTACCMSYRYAMTGDGTCVDPLILNSFGLGFNNSITNTYAPWNFDNTDRYVGSPGQTSSLGTYASTTPNSIAISYSTTQSKKNSYYYPSSISQKDSKYLYTDAVVDIFNQYLYSTTAKKNYPTPDFVTNSYQAKFTGIPQGTTITLPSTFGGAGAGSSFDFPDIPTLVEAARGNLESVQVANSAGLNTTNNNIWPYFTPKAGYYNAYKFASFQVKNPISVAEQSVQSFVKTMNTDVDVHVSFVPFSDNAFANNTFNGTQGSQPIDGGSGKDYPQDAQYGGWLAPGINFSKAVGSAGSNYNFIYNSINPVPIDSTGGAVIEQGVKSSSSTNFLPTGDSAFSQCMTAAGGTNIAGALTQALSNFTSGNSRIKQGAKAVCILFTDGMPTAGGDYGLSDPNAQSAASQLGKNGVVLYCVGLAQTQAIVSDQATVLNGLVSANNQQGAQAFFVSPGSASQQQQQLNQVFANIERSLIALTQ